MTIEELTKIVRSVDEKKIIEDLKRRGYIDCKKHKDCKNISFVELFKGNLLETAEFPDGKNKRSYQGGIITNVRGFENLEFVVININDDKSAFPVDILVWSQIG